jgi:hypothetical protein
MGARPKKQLRKSILGDLKLIDCLLELMLIPNFNFYCCLITSTIGGEGHSGKTEQGIPEQFLSPPFMWRDTGIHLPHTNRLGVHTQFSCLQALESSPWKRGGHV